LSAEKVGPVGRFMNWLSGTPNPSSEYKQEGYLVEDMGPKIFEGKGMEWMEAETSAILARGRLTKKMEQNGI